MSDDLEPKQDFDDDLGPVDGQRLEKFLARMCFGYAILLIFSFVAPFFATPTGSVLGPILIPDIFADWKSFESFNRVLLFGTAMAIVAFIVSYQRSFTIGLQKFKAGLTERDGSRRETTITGRDDPFVVPDLIGVSAFNPRVIRPQYFAYLLILVSIVAAIYGHEAETLGLSKPVKWGLAVGVILEIVIAWYYLTMRGWIRSVGRNGAT
ncbi:MAG: hypothetical protein O3B37_09590 [Proteobacteria bacterium]|nr:hypothetical protein [Pseudomonadota bacterium]